MKTKLKELKERATRFYRRHELACLIGEALVALGAVGTYVYWANKAINEATISDRVNTMICLLDKLGGNLSDVGLTESQFQDWVYKSI